MFDNIRQKIISNRADDEMLYEFVLDEIERGTVIKGLWGKAQADSGGDTANAESIYLKYRVQSIKDAFTMSKIAYKGYTRSELYTYINDKLFIGSHETIHLTSSRSQDNSNYVVSSEDEEIYEQVAQELAKKVRKEGLWLKALENTEGDEVKANALYIKYRSQSIKTEIAEALKRELEQEKLAEMNRLELKAKEAEHKRAEEIRKQEAYNNSPERKAERLAKKLKFEEEERRGNYIGLAITLLIVIVISVFIPLIISG